jgi:ABC-type phosphate transport system substrate-binding protein
MKTEATEPNSRSRRASILMLILCAAAVVLVRTPQARVEASRSKAESLAIIVNQANPTDDLPFKELRALFLGERSHWPNGRRITLVMMEPGPERDAVLREVCRMSESDFRRHFLQGLLTGEVLVSPKNLATAVGVRKFVFNVPGAIGYVRPEDVDESVKVIRINGLLPSDADYVLRVPERPER